MPRALHLSLAFLLCAPLCPAQAPPATAALHEIHSDGQKFFTEAQVVAVTGLVPGSQVGKKDLQDAADRLVQSGLFTHVSYSFQSKVAGVTVTYHIEEAQRVSVYFDNLPWFTDAELADAVRAKLPFFDSTLPEGGTIVDDAADALKDFLSSRSVPGSLEHMLLNNPNGPGNIQQFHIEGVAAQISSLEFSDASLSDSLAVRQHFAEIIGKPYSRMAIDLFLAEAIRPIYLQKGNLRAKLGPATVRLPNDPAKKFPSQIPVFVPLTPGDVYHWKSAQWSGNTLVSEFTLAALFAMKPGDVADGMKIEAGIENVREEYAHRGYLESSLDPVPAFDDQSHTVSYSFAVHEGPQYHFGKMVLTGISPAAERKLNSVWPFQPGAIFDKAKFEDLLAKLQTHQAQIFGELPVHYENIGHWLQTDSAKGTVDVLLDFK